MKKAIVLLSGGIDSQTCLAIARHRGYDSYALAVDYGQRHSVELTSAERIATAQGAVDFRKMTVNLGQMEGVALLDLNQAIPAFDNTGSVKSTFVPGRNTLFLALALSWADSIQAEAIFFGANRADFHGFPDTRPEYFAAFERLAQMTIKDSIAHPVSIETPLLHLEKPDIIKLGLTLGVDYSLSTTCYQATLTQRACGYCDSCTIRREAFRQLGLEDQLHEISEK